MRAMKTRLALLFALLASGPMLAQPAAPSPVAPKGAKTAPTKAPKEEARIAGTVIVRTDGRFLGLTLAEGKFKLRFYGKDRKPVRADVLRVVARWPNVHGPGQNRTVLTPSGDGTFVLGMQFVRPPHAFKLFLTLITAEGAEPTETYSVDFRG